MEPSDESSFVNAVEAGAATEASGASLAFWTDEADDEVIESSSFLLHGLVHDLTNHLTVIAHSAELAEMLHDLARYKEMCGQITEACEKARAALHQVDELARRRGEKACHLDLYAVTREIARRVRAWLPEADFLRTAIPVEGATPAEVFGNAREIQELFLYLAGVLAPLEIPDGQRRRLIIRMEPIPPDRPLQGVAWVFEPVGGTGAPPFWRALLQHYVPRASLDAPLAVHRAGRILAKHRAVLERCPETAGLRVLWPKAEG